MGMCQGVADGKGQRANASQSHLSWKGRAFRRRLLHPGTRGCGPSCPLVFNFKDRHIGLISRLGASTVPQAPGAPRTGVRGAEAGPKSWVFQRQWMCGWKSELGGQGRGNRHVARAITVRGACCSAPMCKPRHAKPRWQAVMATCRDAWRYRLASGALWLVPMSGASYTGDVREGASGTMCTGTTPMAVW